MKNGVEMQNLSNGEIWWIQPGIKKIFPKKSLKNFQLNCILL